MSAGRLRDPWAKLTEAEAQVAKLITEGLSNPEIAARLGLSEDGTKSRVRNIHRKLGVRNRTQVAVRLTAGMAPQVATLATRLHATPLDDGQRELVDQLLALVTPGSRA